jgi:transcriptional regulator with XRE-family HTH domain
MAEGQGPAITRRRLRVELRKLREQRSLPQAEVVRKLDWSSSKLIRIENGSVGVSVTDVRALLGLYKAGDEVIDDLVNLARTARERRWWSSYRDVLSPQYQEFIGFEADASALRQLHPTLVPGLLQTEAYVREIIPALSLTKVSDVQLESYIQVRLRRQQEVVDGSDPPEITIVLDEGSVRRPVGGVEAMREQLEHLIDVAQYEHVTIGVLPFSVGPHVGMQGAYHIMEFADDADDSVLYLENAQTDIALREQPEVIDLYTRHLDMVLERSLVGDAAADYLRKIGREL